MKCPYLVMYDLFYCVSTDQAYRPAQHRLNDYCHSRRHRKCHVYKSFLDNQKPISYSL